MSHFHFSFSDFEAKLWKRVVIRFLFFWLQMKVEQPLRRVKNVRPASPSFTPPSAGSSLWWRVSTVTRKTKPPVRPSFLPGNLQPGGRPHTWCFITAELESSRFWPSQSCADLLFYHQFYCAELSRAAVMSHDCSCPVTKSLSCNAASWLKLFKWRWAFIVKE